MVLDWIPRFAGWRQGRVGLTAPLVTVIRCGKYVRFARFTWTGDAAALMSRLLLEGRGFGLVPVSVNLNTFSMLFSLLHVAVGYCLAYIVTSVITHW